jgi:hypothetical protein
MYSERDKISRMKFDIDYNNLTELVNDWDPVGLIGCGAPIDEYNCLTGQILSALYKGAEVNELTSLVVNEVSDHFGYFLQPTVAKNECARIVDWYKEQSCNGNEQRLVSVIVEKELKEISHLKKSQGQHVNPLELLVPTEVEVDADSSDEPYKMWLVLRQNHSSTKGMLRLILFDLYNNIWGAAMEDSNNNYTLEIVRDSLLETLEVL